MSTIKKFLLIVTIFISSMSANAEDNISSVPTLIVAANFDSEPFLFMDKDSHITGFEVDLLQAIGQNKGFKVKFVPAIFPQVFKQLTSHKIDMVGHVFNDEERKKLYNLTKPHYIDKVEFIALAKRGINDPLSKGLTVATLAFSPIEEEFVQKINVDHPTLKMQRELTTYLGFKDLFNNKADILLTTSSNINRLKRNYSNYEYKIYKLPEKYAQTVPISFLTRKEDNNLFNKLNSGLQELVQNGTYNKLKAKYHL